MYADLIIAGFGGQGILLAGNLLAFAAMEHGLNTTFIPVYGPEMRGGTANCTVVISDQEIGSPFVQRPLGLIVLNRPSLEKYAPRLSDQGICVVNTSLAPAPEDNGRVKLTPLPAGDIAEKLGNARMTNMVALGAYLKASGVLPLSRVQEALKNVVSAHYQHMIVKNAEALQAGYDAA